MDKKKNFAHSVFQRLLNRSKIKGEDFNLLLIRYGIERFLYRLSVSSYSDKFVLKGASLFLVWKGQNYRVTRDADFMATGNPDRAELAEIFEEICLLQPSPEDGIVYLPDSLKVKEIREDVAYGGMRTTLVGVLNEARIPLQIDVGFGDAITPAPEAIEYPVLLDAPVPKLMAYPCYTLVAEKLEAMVHLGETNSRMKDFYDICLVSRLLGFDGNILRQAIVKTFNRRETTFPKSIPLVFLPDFYDDSQKKIQWKAFIRKAKVDVQVGSLGSAIDEVSRFIMPVLDAIRADTDFNKYWRPSEGWGTTAQF